MQLCRGLLRALIAPARLVLAAETGSTYYPRLLAEYTSYWDVAPVTPAAIFRRCDHAPSHGREVHHKRLSLRFFTKVAVKSGAVRRPNFLNRPPRKECCPTFLKEEWGALQVDSMQVNDFIKSGGHCYVLIKVNEGDNRAARLLKRQQRRAWYG